MKKRIKISIFIIFLLLFSNPIININAIPGCCSWHGGEVGCSGGRTLCADGTISSCVCDGTNNSIGGDDTNNSISSDDNNDSILSFLFMFSILFIVFYPYIIDFFSYFKSEKKNLINKEENYKKIEYIKEKITNEESDDINKFDIEFNAISNITKEQLIEIFYTKNLSFNKFKELLQEISKTQKNYKNTFSEICLIFSDKSKITDLEKQYIKYVSYNFQINNKKIILNIVENKHLELFKYMILNYYNDLICFDSYDSIKIFDFLFDNNENKLINFISNKKNFIFEFNIIDINKIILLKEKDKFQKYLQFFKIEISKEKNILKIIELLRKEKDIYYINTYFKKCRNISKFLKENGAFVIYLLTKSLNFDSIEYIFNNYNSIDLNKSIDGMTPLIYACYRNSYRIVEMIVSYGANLNYPDQYKNTALEYACYLKQIKICELLVNHECVLKDEFYQKNDD